MNKTDSTTKIGKSQFGRKISLIIVSSASVILITALTTLMLLNTSEINKQLDETLSSLTELLKTSLVSVVWHLDEPAMNNVLEALVYNEVIIYADISVDGKLIVKKQRPEYKERDFPYFQNSSDFVLKAIEIKYLDKPIGLVRIAVDYRKALYYHLFPQLIKIAILTFIGVVLSAAMSIFIAKRFIFKPLSQLEEIAIFLMKGKLDVPETFSQFVKREDVFGMLGKAFVEMVTQLKNNIRTLDAKVGQRTKELEKSIEEAVAASKAKGAFLSNMSHEIRTPLNTILGMTELLQESPTRDDRMELIRSMDTSGETLLTLTNHILDLSKIESGQLELEKIEFNLNDQIDDLCQILQVQAREKGLTFNCHIDEDVYPYRIGDPNRLRQILINLLGNAIKFTGDGGVTFIIRKNQLSDNNDLNFIVRDTGIGINEGHQAMIFESFTQADMSTSRKFGGSGLGRAITRSLVEKMAGHIRVQSEEGKGTEFTVVLPLTCSTSPAVNPGRSLEQQNQINVTEADDFPELNILLAEDIEENQKVMGLFLKELPITLDIAENGQQAIEKVIRNRYDCVLMDIQMPVVDGFEATRTIREWEANNCRDRVFIMALTAHAFKDEHDKCYAAGCDTVLSKPIKKYLLLNRLRAVAKSTQKVSELNHKSTYRETVDKEVRDLVPEFIQEMRESLNLVETALKIDDFKGVSQLSAGFKDAAQTYNLKHLSEIFSNLHHTADAHNRESARSLLNSAVRYIQEVEITYV